MKTETKQLEHWTGKFGEEYIARNSRSPEKRELGKKAFTTMLQSCHAQSILEVGSNIGLNLEFIQAIENRSFELYALEPNQKAYENLKEKPKIKLKQIFNTTAFDIPIADESIDLVFTSGVLIHIHPDNLLKAATEITRVSRRYVLCSEYFSHVPQSIPYHGHEDLLFKRDFGAFYLEHFSLNVVDYGFLWQKEYPMFDNLNWWLFEKQN